VITILLGGYQYHGRAAWNKFPSILGTVITTRFLNMALV